MMHYNYYSLLLLLLAGFPSISIAAEQPQEPSNNNLRIRKLPQNERQQEEHQLQQQQQQDDVPSPRNLLLSDDHDKPNSTSQIAISTEIEVLEIWEIAKLFQEHEYVGFLHFPRRDDHVSTGAIGVFTTLCHDEFGRNGAVFCEDGLDKCVTYEFLQHPTNTGRAGYCHDFLPLDEDLQAALAVKNTGFALALFQTCMEKGEDCL